MGNGDRAEHTTVFGSNGNDHRFGNNHLFPFYGKNHYWPPPMLDSTNNPINYNKIHHFVSFKSKRMIFLFLYFIYKTNDVIYIVSVSIYINLKSEK